jgi:IS5 family transposase
VVRVVTGLVGRLAKALKLRRIKGFRDRRRSARRRMYEIQRMTTRQRHDQQARTYGVLIGIAEEVVVNARAALEKTGKMRGRDMFADMAIEELRKQIEHFCQLGSRVIDQARQGTLACRVRAQGFSCRKRAGSDHAIRSAEGKSLR